MKAGITSPLFASLMGLGMIAAFPPSASSTSFSSRIATETPSSVTPSDYVPVMTASSTASTPENNDGLRQFARKAPRNPELETENAYNRAARDVQNLALKGRIEAVLHEDKSTRGSNVHVTADNGTVTLWGQVPSERRAQTVQQMVANVDGVKTVNNQLTYPQSREVATPPDADSIGVAHPAYSDLAPAERAPAH